MLNSLTKTSRVVGDYSLSTNYGRNACVSLFLYQLFEKSFSLQSERIQKASLSHLTKASLLIFQPSVHSEAAYERHCPDLSIKTSLPGYTFQTIPVLPMSTSTPATYSARLLSGERSAWHLHAQSCGMHPTASMNPTTTVKLRNY